MAEVTLNPAVGANAPVDGHVYRGSVSETWATIKAGALQAYSDTIANGNSLLLRSTATTNQYQYLTRSVFGFDLSSISSGSKINSAILSLYGSNKVNGNGSTPYDICSADPDSNSTLSGTVLADLGTTPFASISYASFSASAYNDFTLNAAGITYTEGKLGGYVFYSGRLGWETDTGGSPTWASLLDTGYDVEFADNAGNKPKLVINYTEPGGSTAFFI